MELVLKAEINWNDFFRLLSQRFNKFLCRFIFPVIWWDGRSWNGSGGLIGWVMRRVVLRHAMVDVLFVKSFSNSQRPAMSRLDTPPDILETATFLFALSCHFVSCASFWHDCPVVLSQQTRTHPSTISLTMAAAHFLTQTLKKETSQRKMSISIILFHLLLYVSPLPTVFLDSKEMDGWKKKNPIVFFTLFFFSFLPLRWWLMVCYSLDTSVWWWRKFSLSLFCS